MRSAGAAQACCTQRERANSAESSQAERRWEAGICRGSYKRLTPYFIVMFPVFAVERAKTGFVLSPATGLLCVKRAQNMRCKFRGKCVIFSFVFLRGLFMRLRARGNGKGTHEGCLCCIFARRRGQKHRGNSFLVPLFGGAGQTGEGRHHTRAGRWPGPQGRDAPSSRGGDGRCGRGGSDGPDGACQPWVPPA